MLEDKPTSCSWS